MFTPFIISSIFFIAGFVQGTTGFGSALVAIPLLILVIDIKDAVPLCMLVSLVINIYLAIALRKHLDLQKIRPLCIAALPGIIVGATILSQVNASSIKVWLGILLLVYSLYSLLFSPKPIKIHAYWSYIAGFFSGAIGAAFSAGGPPVIIYTTLKNWSRDSIKATLIGFFLFNSSLIVIVHAVSGLTTINIFTNFMISAPFALLGTVLGNIFCTKIPRQRYVQLIFAFLLLMSIMMIFA